MRTTTTATTSKGTQRMLSFGCVILATAAFMVLNLVGPRALAKVSALPHAFCNLFVSAAAKVAPNQTSCVAPPSGMITWLPGDGNAQDILNNAQDLTLNGGVTFSAGKVAQAFNFDGTGDVTYSTINAGSTYTVDFWIRPTHSANDGQRQEVVSNDNGDPQKFGTITLSNNNQVEYNQNVNFRVQSGFGSVPFDIYTHVALTYDGSVNRLYVNGNLAATSTAHTETFNNPLQLGHSFNDINSRFAGQLDEVEIFNRALSNGEIQSIFNADSAGKCKTLVDADGDGVVDSRDACPNTPLGTTVNAAGCPVGTCLTPPAGMTNWFPGDGSPQDILNHSDALNVNGNVTYVPGKVAQALNFDGAGDVTYSTINAGSTYTVDFWIRPTHSANDGQRQEVVSNDNGDPQKFGTITFANNQIEYNQDSNFRVLSGFGSVPFDIYTHVALTYDGSVNRLYVNGNLAATSTAHTETFNNPLQLGHSFNDINRRFAGQLDEVEIFNRVLSQTEVRGVFNADTTGKCKVPVDADGDGVVDSRDACPGTPAGTTVNAAGCPLGACFPPPTGMTNWFPGDGNANDILGTNNGTPNGGVTFPAGKAGQAFQFDGTGDVSYSNINAGSSYTVDFWMRPAHSAADGQRQDLISNTLDGGNSFGVITFASSQIEYYQSFASSANDAKVRSPQIPYDTYTHLALTYDGSVNRLYINGSLVSTSGGHSEIFNNPIRVAAWIGGGNARFVGQLDEVEIFNRALSQTEVRGILNADTAGKCKPGATPTPTPTPSPTPTPTPTPAPSAERIAFESFRDGNQEIYVMNADGTNQIRLTYAGANDALPRFSLDGTKIAFASDRDGNNEIYVLNPDGSNPTRLTNNPARDYHPSFSPDGSKIVFQSNRDGNGEIYVMNADGTNQTRLTSNAVSDASPSFSPDGTKIVFSSDRDSFSDIYVMNANGTNQTRLTNNPVNDNHPSSEGPSFSPDGSKIVYSGRTDISLLSFEIFVMNANGTNPTRLTNNAVLDVTPSFSPNSSKIAFASTRDGNGEIYVMNADGTNPTRLTSNTSIDNAPNWGVAAPPNTPPGNEVTVQTTSGDARATFAQATVSGTTTFVPITPPSAAGAPPAGYTILNDAPAYDITTTAAYTGVVTVCFTVSTVNDQAEFARVRILHGEGGQLIDRTILFPDSPAPDFATRRACARVNSLSPFVTALAPAATPTPTPTPPTVQFSSPSYSKSESGPSTNITVTRTGDTSGASAVNFSTGNNAYVPCNTVNGVTTQNCDFIISSGTLNFAAGQTSRTFPIIIIDDLFVEGDETLSLSLSSPSGAVLGSQSTATLTIIDNDSVTPATNPLDDARYFVRTHYYDFLGRLPDDGGLDYWSNEITQCGSNPACINERRVAVSNAFFYEQEYQQTASFVFLLYRASFGNNQPFPNPDFFDSNLSAALHDEAKKLPRYLSFARDRAQVVGGSDLAQTQLALANAFVQRPEFVTKYPLSLTTAAQFVDAVLATIRNDSGAELVSQRDTLLGHFNTGGRGLVMFHLANDYWNGCNRLPGSPPAPCVPVGYGDAVDNRAFIDAEYNRSFVYSQYSGYLHRDGDIGGFLFWLTEVSKAPPRNVEKQHGMVCSFITSEGYQRRFSSVVTHSNAECGN